MFFHAVGLRESFRRLYQRAVPNLDEVPGSQEVHDSCERNLVPLCRLATLAFEIVT
jgi:hypothetical protein